MEKTETDVETKVKTRKARFDYAAYKKNERDLGAVTRKYKTAHKWLPRLVMEAPEKSPEELLKKMRERITQLRKERRELTKLRYAEAKEKARQQPDLRKSVALRTSPHTTIESIYRQPMDISDLYPATKPVAGLNLPDLDAGQSRIHGVARASGFQEYISTMPDDMNNFSWIILPNGGGPFPDDFTDATGFQFECEIEDDIAGFAGVLQYTLPEAPWDGHVNWNIYQSFLIPDVVGNSDWSYFWIASVARQSPNGEGFPPSTQFNNAFSMEDLVSSYQVEDDESFHTGPVNFIDEFHSGFPVIRGQRPRIYVGFNILFWAVDGTTWLDGPNYTHQYYPGSGEGLSYEYVKYP